MITDVGHYWAVEQTKVKELVIFSFPYAFNTKNEFKKKKL